MPIRKLWLPLLLLTAALGYYGFIETGPTQRAVVTTDSAQAAAGLDQLMEAFKARRSKLWLEVSGVVSKTLEDDKKGDQHQRFILRLANGHTVLVAHNIDLAPKINLGKGDELVIRGRYEWSERGGVLHWTHHDPRNHIQGGWIQHGGQRYK